MEILTKKLNAFFCAYKCATTEEEKKVLEGLMEETVKEIANFGVNKNKGGFENAGK